MYAKDIVDIKIGEWVASVSQTQDTTNGSNIFTIKTDQGSYNAKTVLVATGSMRRN